MRTVIIYKNDLKALIQPLHNMSLHVTPARHRECLPGIAATALFHALGLALLLSYAPVRQKLRDAAPIMVSLLPLQAMEAEPPQQLPKPRPVVKLAPRKVDPSPQPVLTLPEAAMAPATSTTPPPPVEPRPVETQAAVQVPQFTPPRFNADYLNNPAPHYPAVSRRLREEGRVMLRVYVDPQGAPARVELRTSSGHERLDTVALETVRHWKFVPARRGDEAVSAWVLVPIAFRLRS
jgi:protein TonB